VSEDAVVMKLLHRGEVEVEDIKPGLVSLQVTESDCAWVQLTPTEARALAAALVVYADRIAAVDPCNCGNAECGGCYPS
jgi:hypothetical protein